MSRETFMSLANELQPALQKKITNWRKTIQTVAELFGIGEETLCILIREVCHGIKKLMLKKYIHLPYGNELEQNVSGFAKRGMPFCVGAIDGTHIPIIAPTENPADYHNRKGWYSAILQGIVDHKMCFTDIYVGWLHDARVLANSDIYILAEHRQGGYLYAREHSGNINGLEIPLYLIGDPAYPLKNEKRIFNHRLSSARIIVEHAFGRLKGRWRCLLKRNDININTVSDVVVACCVLHNFCELHGEQYPDNWDCPQECVERPVANNREDSVSAVSIRDALLTVV
ncbi:putative nuclease HARBI1 [Triplophysa rosa]|uniref:Nuclease HARBI1 n=1 Tax=Triplophysa rosa TaxID=992332 RepID=A0A9W7TRM5_TRIRA|nr:putative nuclease HARBI1 [Triplophysa rosa]